MRFIKRISTFLLIGLLIVAGPCASLLALSNETPGLMLTGMTKAPALLINMDFTDVKGSSTWAKPAIYESAALEFMKGSNRRFGITDVLTVEQALAIAYNAIGREAEAQQAAEALDLARAKNARLYPAPRMWSDGYIQLAFNDGVITAAEYRDAINTNQLSLGPDAFFRNASATREDVAWYMGKILGLDPQNAQTRIFNSYSDWNQADPHKVPYIEAMLQNNIMSDDGRGRFRPTANVTRAEMAQILVNAEPVLFNKLGWKKMKGTVENVTVNQDLSDGQNLNAYSFDIRNSGGDLHRLSTLEARDPGTARNELTGAAQNPASSSVVNRNNTLSLAGTLKAGEQIVYFVNANNEVPYIQVISAKTDTRYYLGRVDSKDAAARKVGFSKYVELPFADVRLADSKTLSRIQPSDASTTYSVSNAARVYTDVEQGGFDLLQSDQVYVITVKNGVIDRFDKSDLGLLEESGLASGVVKEVNPSLGYVTLYFSDGSGADPDAAQKLSETRTYSYAYEVPVYRDGTRSSLEKIMPGDHAFVQLDEDGIITRLSAQSYYRPLYGTVHSKGPNYLVVKDADGRFQNYTITPDVSVYRRNRPVSFSEVAAGDTVRLLIQSTGEALHIAGIDLEKSPKLVSALYRGDIEGYNTMNQTLSLSGVQEFVNGRWEETSFLGVKPFTFSREYEQRPAGRLSGKAYIAVSKDAEGQDRIISAAYRTQPHYETTLKDSLLSLSNTTKRMNLVNTNDRILFDAGTIAIQDGRLVDIAALNTLDPVSLSAEKPYGNSDLLSHVIVSDTQGSTGNLAVYRGRIKAVDPLKSFTVESFAELSGVSWNFSNTPKTFTIDLAATRLLESDGTGNMRDFAFAYVNQSVYAVTHLGKTVLVSTAPYADAAFRGRVEQIIGGTQDASGAYLSLPTGIRIKEATRFNATTFLWESIVARDMTIPSHAVVIKDGNVTDTSSIKPGDQVRILANATSGDGVVIIIE